MPPSPNNRLAISPQQQLLLLLPLRAEENEVVVAFDEDANAWLSARRMFLLLLLSLREGFKVSNTFLQKILNFQDVDDDTNTLSTRGRNRRLCVVPILSFWRRYV